MTNVAGRDFASPTRTAAGPRVDARPCRLRRPWLQPSPLSPNRGVSPESSKVVRACALIAALSILAELGGAEGAPVGHSGPWPIHNGLNHQPTQDELRALHQQDVTSDQAHEIDRLYDELLSTSDKILGRRPARAPLTGVVGWIGRSMNRQ
jgi:hypothetical protein